LAKEFQTGCQVKQGETAVDFSLMARLQQEIESEGSALVEAIFPK